MWDIPRQHDLIARTRREFGPAHLIMSRTLQNLRSFVKEKVEMCRQSRPGAGPNKEFNIQHTPVRLVSRLIEHHALARHGIIKCLACFRHDSPSWPGDHKGCPDG